MAFRASVNSHGSFDLAVAFILIQSREYSLQFGKSSGQYWSQMRGGTFARLRRRHRRCGIFADRPLDDALSSAASIAERGMNRQDRCLALSRKLSIHLRAGNFHGATRAGRDLEAEAMQFDDCGDHAQPEAQTFDVSTLV